MSIVDPSGVDPLRLGVVMLVGQLVTFGFLLVAQRWWLSRLEPSARGPAVLAAVAGACALRGVVSGFGLMMVGISSTPNLGYRVPGSLFSMGVVLVLCDLVVGSSQRHRARLAALAARRADLHAARTSVREQIHTRQDDLVADIRRELFAELSDLSVPGAVAGLHRLAAEVVRPLSHRLARELMTAEQPAAAHTQRVGTREFLDEVTRSCDVPALGVPLILALLGSVYPMYSFGPRLGLLVLGVTVVVAWLMLTLVSVVLRGRFSRWSMVGRVIAITVALGVSSTVAAASAWLVVYPRPGTTGMVVGVGLLIPLLGWMVLMARATEVRRLAIEADLRDVEADLRWELARLHEIDWQMRRVTARALHGPVQSAIGGAGLRLDLAERTGSVTPELVVELMAGIERALESLGREDPPTPLVTLADELALTYEGVCAVTIDVAHDVTGLLAADAVCASAVNAIVTEGTWNAVHHRACSHVCVRVVKRDHRSLTIDMVGSGAGRPAALTGANGLGTEILNDVTLEWVLEESTDGARLRAVLPLIALKSTVDSQV